MLFIGAIDQKSIIWSNAYQALCVRMTPTEARLLMGYLSIVRIVYRKMYKIQQQFTTQALWIELYNHPRAHIVLDDVIKW